MKNKISNWLLAVVTVAATAGNASAQRDWDMAFIPAANQDAYHQFLRQYTDTAVSIGAASGASTATARADAKAAKARFKATKANNKALMNFNNNYKNVGAAATWAVMDDGMTASFREENTNTCVAYNKRGKWLHTLTYLPADKTPADIADVIDYAYPKDTILLTIQVQKDNQLCYIVQLEGKTTFKKVLVRDGEVTEIESLIKAS